MASGVGLRDKHQPAVAAMAKRPRPPAAAPPGDVVVPAPDVPVGQPVDADTPDGDSQVLSEGTAQAAAPLEPEPVRPDAKKAKAAPGLELMRALLKTNRTVAPVSATDLTEAEFAAADRNQDGKIDRHELRLVQLAVEGVVRRMQSAQPRPGMAVTQRPHSRIIRADRAPSYRRTIARRAYGRSRYTSRRYPSARRSYVRRRY